MQSEDLHYCTTNNQSILLCSNEPLLYMSLVNLQTSSPFCALTLWTRESWFTLAHSTCQITATICTHAVIGNLQNQRKVSKLYTIVMQWNPSIPDTLGAA